VIAVDWKIQLFGGKQFPVPKEFPAVSLVTLSLDMQADENPFSVMIWTLNDWLK
jgi:hypothetical protein